MGLSNYLAGMDHDVCFGMLEGARDARDASQDSALTLKRALEETRTELQVA